MGSTDRYRVEGKERERKIIDVLYVCTCMYMYACVYYDLYNAYIYNTSVRAKEKHSGEEIRKEEIRGF